MSAARPRDCVTARLQVSAPGQATTSRASSAPGVAMSSATRRAWRSRSWSSREAAEHEVLAVGDAQLEHAVEVELALDRRDAAELIGGDVAEPAVRVGADRAVRAPAHDVGELPAVVRVEALQLDGLGLRPDHRGRARCPCRPARRRAPGRSAGCRSGYGRRRDEEAALLEDALAQLVDAHRVDEPLHAGPELVVAVAVVVEHAQRRLDRREQLGRGV